MGSSSRCFPQHIKLLFYLRIGRARAQVQFAFETWQCCIRQLHRFRFGSIGVRPMYVRRQKGIKLFAVHLQVSSSLPHEKKTTEAPCIASISAILHTNTHTCVSHTWRYPTNSSIFIRIECVRRTLHSYCHRMRMWRAHLYTQFRRINRFSSQECR